MADTNKAKDPEKTADLPPYGSRNADPLTDTPGSHPIETGIGAVVGGAASGLAVGAVGGPVGAVLGAIAGGALAGGLAGKGIGELVDPTTQDNWLREYFGTRTDKTPGRTPEDYRDAYRYGMDLSDRHTGRTFDDLERDAQTGWEQARGTSSMTWDEARGATRHAYDRAGRYRQEQAGGTDR